MKSFFALAILSTIAAVPAMAESFTRDGESYTYTISSVGDAKLISGTHVTTGKSFRLLVSGNRVNGRFGDAPVSFRVPAAEVAVRGSAVMAAK